MGKDKEAGWQNSALVSAAAGFPIDVVETDDQDDGIFANYEILRSESVVSARPSIRARWVAYLETLRRSLKVNINSR